MEEELWPLTAWAPFFPRKLSGCLFIFIFFQNLVLEWEWSAFVLWPYFDFDLIIYVINDVILIPLEISKKLL